MLTSAVNSDSSNSDLDSRMAEQQQQLPQRRGGGRGTGSSPSQSTSELYQIVAIALNNTGVALLQRNCHRDAINAFKNACHCIMKSSSGASNNNNKEHPINVGDVYRPLHKASLRLASACCANPTVSSSPPPSSSSSSSSARHRRKGRSRCCNIHFDHVVVVENNDINSTNGADYDRYHYHDDDGGGGGGGGGVGALFGPTANASIEAIVNDVPTSTSVYLVRMDETCIPNGQPSTLAVATVLYNFGVAQRCYGMVREQQKKDQQQQHCSSKNSRSSSSSSSSSSKTAKKFLRRSLLCFQGVSKLCLKYKSCRTILLHRGGTRGGEDPYNVGCNNIAGPKTPSSLRALFLHMLTVNNMIHVMFQMQERIQAREYYSNFCDVRAIFCHEILPGLVGDGTSYDDHDRHHPLNAAPEEESTSTSSSTPTLPSSSSSRSDQNYFYPSAGAA